MAQHGLYIAKVGPSLEQVRCKTVPEGMRTYVFSYPGIGRCAFLNVRRVIYHGGAKGFPWGAVRGN